MSSKSEATTMGLLGLLILAQAALGSLVPWYYRAMPYHEFAASANTDALDLAPNNGWALAKPYAQSGLNDAVDSIHVVYHAVPDTLPHVYYLLTTNYRNPGSWSSAYCLSEELRQEPEYDDSAHDATVACLGDTVAVAFYDEFNEDSRERNIAFTYRSSQVQWHRVMGTQYLTA